MYKFHLTTLPGSSARHDHGALQVDCLRGRKAPCRGRASYRIVVREMRDQTSTRSIITPFSLRARRSLNRISRAYSRYTTVHVHYQMPTEDVRITRVDEILRLATATQPSGGATKLYVNRGLRAPLINQMLCIKISKMTH